MIGLEENMRHWQFEYSFAKEGGAIGDITLRGPAIPPNALIIGGIIDVENAVTAGGAATIALRIEGAADLLAAAAIAGFTANAQLATVPVFTAATTKRVTATAKKVVATVAAFQLTAGKFTVNLFGIVPR